MGESEVRQHVSILTVKSEAELFQALAIREVVFIEEQHIPEGIERDEEDGDAYHVLALAGGHAIGTGRLCLLKAAIEGESGQWAEIGRMAVLQSHRKGGVGSKLLTALESEALRREIRGITLDAQVPALPFYQKHGYQPVGGAEFEQAGILHLEMKKILTATP